MHDIRLSIQSHAGVLALCLLGCGTWRADPDGLTERDVALLPELVLTGRLPSHPGNELIGDPAVALLGQQLFFDKGLSTGAIDGARSITPVSCVSCHNPGEWFSDARGENNVSKGVGVTSRNSPSLVNVAFYDTFGWDGRADTLWGQCANGYEPVGTMRGNPALLLEAVRSRYADRYAAVFPGQPLPAADAGVAVDDFYRNILKTWATYLTQLTSADAPFDRFALGDREALTVEQRRGLVLFLGKAGCIECHRGPMFTDNAYHSVGIGQSGRGVPETDLGREKGLSVLKTLDDRRLRPEGAAPPPAPTLEDRGLFRTKGLRQVAGTAPYFHAGQVATLKDAVWFYARGGDHAGAGTTSPFLVPLHLSDDEQADLVSFLRSLTGAEIAPELRCDNARPAPLPGAYLDGGVFVLPPDLSTAPIATGDPVCPFGGVLVTQDAGGQLNFTRVCNAAPTVTRCAGAAP